MRQRARDRASTQFKTSRFCFACHACSTSRSAWKCILDLTGKIHRVCGCFQTQLDVNALKHCDRDRDNFIAHKNLSESTYDKNNSNCISQSLRFFCTCQPNTVRLALGSPDYVSTLCFSSCFRFYFSFCS